MATNLNRMQLHKYSDNELKAMMAILKEARSRIAEYMHEDASGAWVNYELLSLYESCSHMLGCQQSYTD